MKSMMICDPMVPAYKVARDFLGNASPFDLLESFLGSEPFFAGSYRTPAVDVRESSDRYTIVAELPGMSEKDIKLEVKDRVLSLSVERKDEDGEKKDEATWIRRERREYAFSRRFTVPENADEAAISARFKDGLLTIELPKKPETSPRTVQVNAA